MISNNKIKHCSCLSNIEKEVILKLIKQEKCDRSGAFIVPNETAFIEIEPAVLFDAIGHLIEQGILKKRACSAVAYEWDDKEKLEKILENNEKVR